jgi:Uma2 family endonuclease
MMSTLTLPQSAPLPGPKRWTVPEFHRLWEDGYFEARKAILLDGEIIDMPIPGPLHNKAVGKADYALKRVFIGSYWVRVQLPLELNLWVDPVPDLAVVPGTPDDHDVNPSTALLVVEVSDSTLSIDLGTKAELYAAARIADYWVVDLVNHRVIVHRNPQPDAASASGFQYQDISPFDLAASFTPLALPGMSIGVSELLPKQ